MEAPTHTPAASLDPRVSSFIERMGMLTEEDGLPRIAGRIFGLLLLTPGDLSLDELASRLEVSKASVSSDARRLEMRGLLERRTRPGDRRDYYAIAPDAFACSIESRLQRVRRFHELLENGRDLASGSAEVRERWAALDAAYDLTVRVLQDALDEVRRATDARPGAARRAGA